jgi:hypothetical protein
LIGKPATGNRTFFGNESKCATFAVSNPVKCRLIRLTQTDKNNHGDFVRQSIPDFTDYYYLRLVSVDFLGILCEEADESLDGIFWHLTMEHLGNVHEKGIVTITSKSVSVQDGPNYFPANVANLTSDSAFVSEDGSGQWIC